MALAAIQLAGVGLESITAQTATLLLFLQRLLLRI
jgi:hypothetical protein